MGLEFAIVGKYRTVREQGYLRPAPDLPALTLLSLRIKPDFDGTTGESWQDDEDGKLEAKIATIAAAIIVAGERKFRRSLREAEKRLERERIEQEKRKHEQFAQLNRQRLQHLQTSGELLRQAQDIRALVERVRQAIVEGSAHIDDPTLKAWENWALAEADRIDPVRSGQVMSHIKEPTL